MITSSVLEYSSGEEVTVNLVYERLERHCSLCFRLDHELRDCLEAKAQKKAQGRLQTASFRIEGGENTSKQQAAQQSEQGTLFRFTATDNGFEQTRYKGTRTYMERRSERRNERDTPYKA